MPRIKEDCPKSHNENTSFIKHLEETLDDFKKFEKKRRKEKLLNTIESLLLFTLFFIVLFITSTLQQIALSLFLTSPWFVILNIALTLSLVFLTIQVNK